jgi:hypothetical protein
MNLEKILADHRLWLDGKGGERAGLTDADLTGANLAYARLNHANLNRADLTGATLTGADLTYARLTDANLAYARLTDARLTGADLYNANLAYARLNHADLTGATLTDADLTDAIIGDNKTVIGLLRRATRSDGYEFFLWHCQEGFYIKAGCRFFSLDEARAHWTATRSGTPLGDETQDILDMFEKAIQRTGEKP